MKVRPDDGDLLEDVLSHTRYLAEEEEGENAGGGTEQAGHEGAVPHNQYVVAQIWEADSGSEQGQPYYLEPLAMLMPWKCFMILYLRANALASCTICHASVISRLLRPILAAVSLVLDSLAPGL